LRYKENKLDNVARDIDKAHGLFDLQQSYFRLGVAQTLCTFSNAFKKLDGREINFTAKDLNGMIDYILEGEEEIKEYYDKLKD